MKLSSAQAAQMQAEAQRRFEAGQFRAAAEILKPLVKNDPRNAALHRVLGVCLNRIWLFPEARRHLIEADKRRPRDPLTISELASTYMYETKVERARELLEKALSIDPGHEPSHLMLARVCLLDGDAEGALEHVTKLSEAHFQTGEVASVYADALDKLGRSDEAIAALERLLPDGVCSEKERALARYKLARFLEKKGEYDKAFEHAQAANTAMRGTFDPGAFERGIDAMLEIWTKEALESLPSVRPTGARPVFVTGMPRSGTTLIEQIISAHSKVQALGETDVLGGTVRDMENQLVAPPFHLVGHPANLKEQELRTHRRKYMQRVRNKLQNKKTFTDKDLHNFWHLWFIQAAFPDARVIHCRRQAEDAFISCYMLQFVGQMSYTNDFESMACVMRASERVMEHWQEVLDIPIMTVQYEDVVNDPEPNMRELVEFAGLEWEDTCAEFYKQDRVAMTASVYQVRKPIYKDSLSRAEKFSGHLALMREAIEKYGL